MSAIRKYKRIEERKYKRVEVRYGADQPRHRGFAVQLSSRGAFLSATKPIYAVGSNIFVEFKTPDGVLVAKAVVRHSKNLPPHLSRFGKPGMGIELVSPPAELLRYLASI